MWSSERILELNTYHIYRDGNLIDSVLITSPNDTTYTDLGLNSDQEYNYFIISKDTLGNESQPSDLLTISTKANSPPYIDKDLLYDRNLKSDFIDFTLFDLDDTARDYDNDPLSFSVDIEGDGGIIAELDLSDNWISIRNNTSFNGESVDIVKITATDGVQSTTEQMVIRKGNFQDPNFTVYPVIEEPLTSCCINADFVVVDFDKDGDEDLVGSDAYAFINNGDNTFTYERVLTRETSNDYSLIKSVDINNDGTLDYFLGTNSIISRFQSPSFLETQVEIPSESISTDIKDIDFYDYDFDGQLDYFFLDGSGNIFIGINDGEGGLESEIQIPLDIESADKFIIGNLNNNTTPDVIVHNGDLQLFYIPDLNPSINIELDNNSNFSAQIILDDIDNNNNLTLFTMTKYG